MILLLMTLVQAAWLVGQDHFLLRKVDNVDRTKNIGLYDVDRVYTIVSVFKGRHVGISDSSLTVQMTRRVFQPYTVTQGDKRWHGKDTVVQLKSRNFSSVELRLDDVMMVRTPLIRKRKWLEPFGWIALGIPLSLPLLPIAAAENGSEGVQNWAEFVGVLTLIVLPLMTLAIARKKHSTKGEWTIAVPKPWTFFRGGSPLRTPLPPLP